MGMGMSQSVKGLELGVHQSNLSKAFFIPSSENTDQYQFHSLY